MDHISHVDSEEIRRKIKQQLEPLFLNFYTGSPGYRSFKESYEFFATKMQKTHEQNLMILKIVLDFVSLLSKSDGKENKNSISEMSEPSMKRTGCLMNIFIYLSCVEVCATPFMDLVILLLASQGQCFHIPPDRDHHYHRHASSLKDLDSPTISLSAKLAFLKESGFTLFSDVIKPSLRNKIAHMDFEIDDAGVLWVGSKRKKTKINIQMEITHVLANLTEIQKYVLDQLRIIG